MIANAVPMTQSDPLFAADNVRIDVDGTPTIDRLTVKTTGNTVIVLGAPRALYEAAAGLVDVTAGALRVAGALPVDALRAASIASAPSETALPPRWTVTHLARESARLAGHTRRDADAAAETAIRLMKLDAVAKVRLGGADRAIRNAAIIAAALATGAETLIVEDFTSGLQDAAARSLARVFVSACEGRRWLLFAGRLALSSPLGLHADEALLFARGRLVCAGPPGEIASRDRTYSVRTSGGAVDTFAAKLRELGATVDGDEKTRALTVTLPEAFSTHELVALARAGGIIVVELLPVSGAMV